MKSIQLLYISGLIGPVFGEGCIDAARAAFKAGQFYTEVKILMNERK